MSNTTEPASVQSTLNEGERKVLGAASRIQYITPSTTAMELTTANLAERGYLHLHEGDGVPDRYSITDTGRDALDALGDLRSPYHRTRDALLLHLDSDDGVPGGRLTDEGRKVAADLVREGLAVDDGGGTFHLTADGKATVRRRQLNETLSGPDIETVVSTVSKLDALSRQREALDAERESELKKLRDAMGSTQSLKDVESDAEVLIVQAVRDGRLVPAAYAESVERQLDDVVSVIRAISINKPSAAGAKAMVARAQATLERLGLAGDPA